MAYYTLCVDATSSPSPPRSRHNAVLSQPSSPSMAVNWDDAEAYLSSDLDISFASTMSINSAPSSPTQTGRIVDPFSLGPAPPPPIERMEISPAVPRLVVPKRAVRINSDSSAAHRPFGVEVSNVSSPAMPDSSPSMAKGTIATRPRSRTTAALPPIRPPQFERSLTSTTQKSSSGTVSASSSARVRAALPNAWLQVPSAISRSSSTASNRSKRNAGVFSAQSFIPSSPCADASGSAMDLDVDISMRSPGAASSAAESSFDVPSLPPTSPDVAYTNNKQADFSGLFYDPSSPDVPTRSSQGGRHNDHDHFQQHNYESSPLTSSPIIGRTRPAQQQSSSHSPTLGAGSKKRRSSEFDEDEESEDVTARVPAANNGDGHNGATKSSGLLFDNVPSSSPPSSPTHRRSKSRCIERSTTLGNGLIGIGGAALNSGSSSSSSASSASAGKTGSLARRSLPKRPPLASLQSLHGLGHTTRTVSSTAALPPTMKSTDAAVNALPNRRAFSACVPKPLLGMGLVVNGSDDCEVDDNDASSDFELSMDSFGHEISSSGQVAVGSNATGSKPNFAVHANAHSPAHRAQMARRENIARFGNRHSAQARMGNGASPIRNPGIVVRSLPGFGDSEADGKVLPCHKVREDGLMRISADTLDDLIHGVYDECIESYTIIDCRFDYEHAGGHIPGAINLNTNEAIEAALLDSGSAECLFSKPPAPSRSGDGQNRKRVLVFHCEFSKKRAPTFAKHLRSKDRLMNGQVYPSVHYPELYILEGGYAQYYGQFSDRCEGSYTRMDDPAHQRARASELNDFRRWNRTRSYTYGELQRITSQAGASEQGSSSQPSGGQQRPVSTDTYMLGGNVIVANTSTAGGATKRALPQSTLHTLTEDGDSSCTSEPDPAESPCPPVGSKIKFAPIKPFTAAGFGSFRPRGMQRALTTALVSARH